MIGVKIRQIIADLRFASLFYHCLKLKGGHPSVELKKNYSSFTVNF